MVTVFVRATPFFGVTVTETLQVPIFRPLRLEPATLQYLAELDNTFTDTFDVERTASLAKAAIDVPDVDRALVNSGIATVCVVTGIVDVGVTVDHSVVFITGEE